MSFRFDVDFWSQAVTCCLGGNKIFLSIWCQFGKFSETSADVRKEKCEFVSIKLTHLLQPLNESETKIR